MADELARWAAERAPRVIARAEAEAAAALRDALLAASTGAREPTAPATPAAPDTAAAPAPAAAAEAEDSAELLWAYCVLHAGDAHPPAMTGVYDSEPVERVEAAGLAALVSRVPASQFGAEPLPRNLNELRWLERVARAHEAVLDQTLRTSTMVPLRLCTLFEGEDSVRQMLEREHDTFADALDALAGREEWGLKMLVDPAKLAEEARAHSEQAERFEQELATTSGGGAYMLRRRLERHVRELSDSLAREMAEQVHACVQDWALDAVSLPPQNRELSGHEGEMLLNAAYLVEADRVAGLRRLVSELEGRHESIGARLELTGPWPPYNFAPDRRSSA